MAAPAPPSPNEPKSVGGDAKASAKPEGDQGDQGPDAGAASAPPAPSSSAPAADPAPDALPLTYAATKNSEAYSTAKAKLNAGDFEGALETVETALKTTLSLLPDADELHESLAPLYYMYGTTLLYSVEESTESAEASVMVQQGQGQEQDAGAGAGGAASAAPNDNAEDLQIAWENLDAARAVVSRIATSSHFARSSSTDPADAEGRDLVLDLAQIHARLGDLQCANGNYGPALADFQRALDVRLEALGRYDRRVADVYYRLGTTCVAMAAEGEKARQQKAVKGEGGSAEEEEKSAPEPPPTPAQIAEHREQSVAHFLSCGRSLGGVVGRMCGRDPDEIAAVPSDERGSGADGDGGDSDSDDEGASSGKGKAKATTAAPSSDDDAKSASSAVSVYASSSAALRAIRERVADLKPADPQDADAVADLRELLDEIQEGIDTAKEDLRCLSDVSEMKAKAEADVEAADRAALREGLEASRADAGAGGGGGGVTTVGFGVPSSSSAATATSKSATATAAPMMVVKKKKKKRDDEGQGKDDSKRAKTE